MSAILATIPALLDTDPYTKPIRRGRFGYTIQAKPGALRARELGIILRERMPELTRMDHAAIATRLRVYADKLTAEWSEVADKAAREVWGRAYHPTDYRISGIASNEFPEWAKDRLRFCDHTYSRCRTFAEGHDWCARYARKLA